MRPADVAEVLASDGLRPAKALRLSMKGSAFSRTLLIDGELAAMFGVRVLQGGAAIPWALTTTVVDRHPIIFWKASLHAVRELAKIYPVLVQCIDARHAQALRWLERLGFVVETEPHECGALGLPFLRATFRKR